MAHVDYRKALENLMLALDAVDGDEADIRKAKLEARTALAIGKASANPIGFYNPKDKGDKGFYAFNQQRSDRQPLFGMPPQKFTCVPSVCDGAEQEAFEEFARSEEMDMSLHPMFWLFLDEKTNAARKGWKGALEYVRNTVCVEHAPSAAGARAEDVIFEILLGSELRKVRLMGPDETITEDCRQFALELAPAELLPSLLKGERDPFILSQLFFRTTMATGKKVGDRPDNIYVKFVE